MATDLDNQIDFGGEDFNGFYYTNEKQIRRMDDAFIISKIIERYPDFTLSNSETTLRQLFLVIASDSKFIRELTTSFDLEVPELFSIIYRNYSEIFNSLFITKVQKLISRKSYAKSAIKSGGARKRQPTGSKSKRRGPGRPPKDGEG